MALERFAQITGLYKKFAKLQHARLGALGAGDALRSERREEVPEAVRGADGASRSVQFHASKIEYLVDQLYSYNRRLTALGGQMLRLAERHRVPRKAFLDSYMGNELDDQWLKRQSGADKKFAAFADAPRPTPSSASAARLAGHRPVDRHGARRVPPDRQPGPEGRARSPHRQEGNGRGQPAPRHLHRQEIHQPRPAVPGPDPGGQHRPDEGGRQVRVPPRLQVLYLRHLVDPAGDHPLDRRPGADHPHPGAHDRDDQQAGPHLPPVPPRMRPASRPRKSWPSASPCRWRRCAR